jgi:hypothetical protein
MHILLIGPFLIWVGVTIPQKKWPYYVLIAFGVFAAIVITSRIFIESLSPAFIWFTIHLLLFIALVLFVGFRGPNAAGPFFGLLIALGFAAIGYHSIRTNQMIMSYHKSLDE